MKKLIENTRFEKMVCLIVFNLKKKQYKKVIKKLTRVRSKN